MQAGGQRVFVSHASEDAATANELVAALEAAGVPCWIAPRDVVPGEEYPVALAAAIDACAVFLLLYTAQSDRSAQVCNETERAASHDKPILLIRADDTDPAQNPKTGFFLTRHHWLNAQGAPIRDFLDAIVSAAKLAVARAGARQPAAPAPAAAQGPANWSIGIDVQPREIRGYVMDLDAPGKGAIGGDYTLPVDPATGNMPQLIRGVEELTRQILDAEFAGRQPVGIGVALAGQVDVRAGVLKFAPNLYGARNVPFQSTLAKRFPGVPIRVDNDVRCATRCEMHLGVGHGYESFACIFVGSGVGSAAVVDRRVVFGHNFCAGEIGHMKIAPTGPPCTCGQIGCLETFIKSDAIVERAEAKVVEWQGRERETVLQEHSGSMTAAHIADALEAGDEAAVEIASEAADHLGVGIANLLNVVNPAAVIIAGGLMMDFFLHTVDRITESVHRNALAEVANTPIVQSAHSDTAAGLGAALLFHPEESWPF